MNNEQQLHKCIDCVRLGEKHKHKHGTGNYYYCNSIIADAEIPEESIDKELKCRLFKSKLFKEKIK